MIERRVYADPKWDEKHLELHKQKVRDGEWYNHVYSYLERAKNMGLDTPQGRQALGKVLTSGAHILETAVEELGDMPKPGYTSGEIHPWGLPTDTKEHDARTEP